jgi:ABC-type sugar transport system permease subunit
MSVETESAPAAKAPPPTVETRRKKIATGEGRLAGYLIAPTLVLLGVVILYPIGRAIWLSFLSDQALTGQFFNKGGNWIGFKHYLDWLLQRCGNTTCQSSQIGGQTYDALEVTVLFTVISVLLEVILGMAMALVMNKSFRGRGLLRAAVLVPWAIPTAVTAKLWLFMLESNGIVNKMFGLHILWKDDKWPSIFAIIIADTWKTTPFMALLILAGLQIIPGDIYESAAIDGATGIQAFRRITLPLVKPALMVAILFRTLDVLRIYDLPAILTQGGGGTGHATTTLSILVVKEIQQGGFSSASALSTLTFLFIFAVAFIFVKAFGVSAVQTQQKAVK